jgi:hypothetical protein
MAQENKQGLKLNGTHQLQDCADDINFCDIDAAYLQLDQASVD